MPSISDVSSPWWEWHGTIGLWTWNVLLEFQKSARYSIPKEANFTGARKDYKDSVASSTLKKDKKSTFQNPMIPMIALLNLSLTDDGAGWVKAWGCELKIPRSLAFGVWRTATEKDDWDDDFGWPLVELMGSKTSHLQLFQCDLAIHKTLMASLTCTTQVGSSMHNGLTMVFSSQPMFDEPGKYEKKSCKHAKIQCVCIPQQMRREYTSCIIE